MFLAAGCTGCSWNTVLGCCCFTSVSLVLPLVQAKEDSRPAMQVRSNRGYKCVQDARNAQVPRQLQT